MNQALVDLLAAYPAPRIEDRPRQAHDVCRWLRARGWDYDPSAAYPWTRGDVEALTADDAVSFELEEPRVRAVRPLEGGGGA